MCVCDTECKRTRETDRQTDSDRHREREKQILHFSHFQMVKCIWVKNPVLVLIGSHSLCNSFVVNQFLFFHTKRRKFPLLYTQEAMSNMVEKKKICLFFISKIYSHITQKWRPKTGMAIPYACLGSYFIPDENIQICLICLQRCNMQKHQKANFRTAEYVCVQ